MKRILYTVVFLLLLIAKADAQFSFNIAGFVDDTAKNRKIFILYSATNCIRYDTAKTVSGGYFQKTLTIPSGCKFGLIRVKMVNCNSDTLYQYSYYDTSSQSTDTAVHNFKYCDTCGYISANFSRTVNSGLTVKFANYSYGANKYIWSFGDATSSTAGAPTKTYASVGNYQVCLVAVDSVKGCEDTTCKFVNVQNPCANFDADFSFSVSSLTVTFTNLSSSNANKFSWNYGDSSAPSSIKDPTRIYTNYKNRLVCLIARDTINNCADTVCKTVTFVNPCTGVFAYFKDSVNKATKTVKFTDSSWWGANKYYWDFGNGDTSSAKNPVHTYGSYGTYTVCLIAKDTTSGGCSDTICRNINVFATCTGFTANFTIDSTVTTWLFFANRSSANANKFMWDFGDGNTSNAKHTPHTYASPGIYNICLIAQDTISGCADTVCHDTLVTNYKCNGFAASFSTSYYKLNVTVTNTSPVWADKFYWDFGDGYTTTVKNPGTHTYSSPGSYLVTLAVKDTLLGCIDTIRKTLNIVGCGSYTANFTNRIVGDTMRFTNTTTAPGSGFTASYYWMFGDGNTSTQANPKHKYSTYGVYNVCMVAQTSNGCVDTVCNTVVYSRPACSTFVANFFPSLEYNAVTGFVNISDTKADLFYWTFGDGNTSTAKNPVNNYAAPGTYNVCLVAIDTAWYCYDTLCRSVTVTRCRGFYSNFVYNTSASYNTVFKDSSATYANKFTWDFGDGNTSTAENPMHQYAAAGTYNVCLIATDTTTGCTDTMCKNVTISNCSTVSAGFTYKDTCLIGKYTNISTGANRFHWDFGNGNTLTTIYKAQHHNNYGAPGTYNVCLVAEDTISGCVDTTCINGITISRGISGFVLRDSSVFADTGIVYLIQVTIDTITGDTILTAIDSTYLVPFEGYTFSNVATGNYHIKAALLPTASFYANRIPTYHGNVTQWRDASVVNVSTSCTNADIILITGSNPGGLAFIGGYVAAGANKQGDPLEKMQVNIYSADGKPFGYTYTDANGEYKFDNILYGTYKVIVEIPGKPCQEFIATVSATNPGVNNGNFEVNSKDITLKISTGIALTDVIAGGIAMFPNPAKDKINISYTAINSGAAQIQITDITGKRMISLTEQVILGSNTLAMDINDLPNGVYIVNVTIGNSTYTNKMIVSK